MPSPLNVTNIPAPRTPLIDASTGLLTREWYRFFLNLFVLTGSGSNPIALNELELGPPSVTVDEITQQNKEKIPSSPNDSALVSQIAELQKQIQAVELSIPSVVVTSGGTSSATSAPVTKTTNFTVADTDIWIINNKAGSTCTVTLPTASSYVGRSLTFQNYQNQQLVSVSSNVVPLSGGPAGVEILADLAGDWATVVSDGTNWVVMLASSSNFEFLATENNEILLTENNEALILNT